MTTTTYEFNIDENYHEQFNEYVKEIVSVCSGDDYPQLDERLRMVGDLIDSYVDTTGERPPTKRLNDLARSIDTEYYKAKVKQHVIEDYPYLTDTQELRRKTNERGDHLISTYDSENRNQSPSTRLNRRGRLESTGDDYMSQSIPPMYSLTFAY